MCEGQLPRETQRVAMSGTRRWMEKLQQRYTPFDGNDVAVKFKLPLQGAWRIA